MQDTPQRKEPKRFEPPPWEVEVDGTAAQSAAQSRVASEHETAAAETPAPKPGAEEAAGRKGVPVDPAAQERVDTMFTLLRAEEASESVPARTAGLAASVVMGLVGIVLLIWGVVALGRTAGAGVAGALGSAIVLTFGAFFLGVGVWTAMRIIRQQGER